MRGDADAAAEAADRAVGLARRGAGILEVANALSTRAEILGHRGEHLQRQASCNEAAMLLRGCADAGIVAKPLAAARRDRPMVAEELTAKEHEILGLLATRLSRREIGERLYVSLNTVKTHQRAVYRKLGVESRTAAVTRARELGLRYPHRPA